MKQASTFAVSLMVIVALAGCGPKKPANTGPVAPAPEAFPGAQPARPPTADPNPIRTAPAPPSVPVDPPVAGRRQRDPGAGQPHLSLSHDR